MGCMYLVLIDDIFKVDGYSYNAKDNSRSYQIKDAYEFANRGFPEVLATDKGPLFTGKE